MPLGGARCLSAARLSRCQAAGLFIRLGILWLATAAGLLLITFGGITDRLIPLFAVGAFTAFTLSQLGMAVHWHRQAGNRLRLAVNGIGAAGTGAALCVILGAKFLEGAWITVVVIPCVLTLLKLIKRYYRIIDRELHADSALDLSALKPPLALIPIVEWNRLTEKAVRYGLMIAPEVIAIHLTRLQGPDAEEHNGRLRRQWRQFVELPAQKVGLRCTEIASYRRRPIAALSAICCGCIEEDQSTVRRAADCWS